MGWTSVREAGVRVVKQREDGIVRRVVLLNEAGDEVVPVNRFLSHHPQAAEALQPLIDLAR